MSRERCAIPNVTTVETVREASLTRGTLNLANDIPTLLDPASAERARVGT